MGKLWDALLEADARLSARLRLDPARRAGWRLFAVLAHSGDSWVCMALLVAVWAWGSPEWHRKAALLAIAVGGQALAIFGLKHLIRRPRPHGEWGAIYRSVDPHSFPSGHATRVALLAVMAAGLGPGWFALALLVWAPLVALARVVTGVHYLSDILAGVFIGAWMGLGMLALQPQLVRWFAFLF